MSRHFLAAGFLLVATAVPGPASTQEPTKANPDGDHAPGSVEYRIGPEDVLKISVWKNESLSQTVPVRPDGKISLPLLNDVEAAGRTPTELRNIIAKKLAEYMPAAEVSVIVSEVRSFKVSVIGEVGKPDRYELKSRATVLDLLAQAGGFTQFASRSRIVVLRPNGEAMERIPFNYNKAITTSGERENFPLRPGDIVVVP